jgi:hypothetical protein
MKENDKKQTESAPFEEYLLALLRRTSFIPCYEYYMQYRWQIEAWKSEEFQGSMLEYTLTLIVEEITELETAIAAGDVLDIIDELGDVFTISDVVRQMYGVRKPNYNVSMYAISPYMVIKKLTKLIRFHGQSEWILPNTLQSLFEYISSKFDYYYYGFNTVVRHNVVYFLMSTNFVKGMYRYLRDRGHNLDSILEYEHNLQIAILNNIRDHNKLSKAALKQLKILMEKVLEKNIK